MDFTELDKYFNENDEPNKEIFSKLTTSQELHYIAENYNWDNGIGVLEWIINSKLCSEATALMIFWQAQPYDYIKYNYNAKKIKYADMDVFNLIKKIMENYKNGYYKKTPIKYNPEADMPKTIPEIMFQETNGEEPYIYYDEKEAFSIYGDYLNGLLARCDNSMELYNIVYLLSSNVLYDNYEKILEHKNCDKGIALMIYWKLGAYNWDDSYIMNKIMNNEYSEIIKYKPDDYRKGK
jgi:hypothetical protein